MASRAEVTSRYARVYARGSKKDKGLVWDQVVAVTGWSRDNARRRLVAAASKPPGPGREVAKTPRKPRAPRYSYGALKVLQRVWAASGGQCGKYLAASMRAPLRAAGASYAGIGRECGCDWGTLPAAARARSGGPRASPRPDTYGQALSRG